jgi:ubiquinone/menaquinone biosynthesis C-methylase UbiE
VDQAELVGLLRGGVEAKGGNWADLGAGDGAFTMALAELLGPGAHITAVDRDASALRRLAAEVGRRLAATQVETLVADFRKTLPLAALDGVVMANSLHFLRDKSSVLASVNAMLRPGGRLIVVEYGSDRGNPWVPHPFTYARWEQMAAEAGFEQTRQLGAVPSRYLGSMYSAVTFAPPSRKSD